MHGIDQVIPQINLTIFTVEMWMWVILNEFLHKQNIKTFSCDNIWLDNKLSMSMFSTSLPLVSKICFVTPL